MSMVRMGMKRMIRKRKYVGKRILSAALGLMLLVGCLAGCGNSGAIGDGQDGAQGSSMGGQSIQQYEEGTPMGRYVEKAGEFGDGAGLTDNSNRLFKLNNGQMVITDAWSPFVISKDGGQRWYRDKRAWNTRMVENRDYIMSAAVGGDNTVAVIYQPADSQDSTGTLLNPQLLIIKPDKTEIPVEVEL
ncbi:MAG: hypothetical protein K2N77_02435, partial [Lachnospiraceae bacterium]|nr:hypothetical protein [Lachnospiraceae bacterium]